MKITIKCRFTDKILFEGEYESTKHCVEVAVAKGANLSGAYLSGAYLRGAYLSDAYLSGANLGGANLGGANLGDAYLQNFKTDLIAEILKLPDELENLRDTLLAGKIDGSTYTGECACLAGTIAKHRGQSIASGGKIKENGVAFVADSSSPREQWFMNISKGDTPEKNSCAKLALEWIEEAIVMRDHIRKGAAIKAKKPRNKPMKGGDAV